MKNFQNSISDFYKLNCFHVPSKINEIVNEIELAGKRIKLFSHPLHLNIVPTKRCNLRCVFCIQYSAGNVDDLSLESFEIIAKKLFPYAKMAHFVSGGEPFLNKSFLQFMAICRDYGIPVRISTNGMLLSKDICKELVRNNSLKIFRFSFDGSRRETVESLRKGIDYYKVIENVRSMADLKKKQDRKDLSLLIRYAVMKSNAEELPELIKKAAEWGIDAVHVCYMNIANSMDSRESLFYYPELAKSIFKKSADMAKNARIRLVLPGTSPAGRARRPCRYPWEFIKIDPNGSVRFCYKAWNNSIGNIFSGNFFDLWNNPHYKLIRKTVNSEKPYFKYCKICSWRQGYDMESSHIQYLHNELYDFDRDYDKTEGIDCA